MKLIKTKTTKKRVFTKKKNVWPTPLFFHFPCQNKLKISVRNHWGKTVQSYLSVFQVKLIDKIYPKKL
jgi:hypothetical protein